MILPSRVLSASILFDAILCNAKSILCYANTMLYARLDSMLCYATGSIVYGRRFYSALDPFHAILCYAMRVLLFYSMLFYASPTPIVVYAVLFYSMPMSKSMICESGLLDAILC